MLHQPLRVDHATADDPGSDEGQDVAQDRARSQGGIRLPQEHYGHASEGHGQARQPLAGEMVSRHVEVSERVDEDRRGIEQDRREPGRCPVDAEVQHGDLDREEHPEQDQGAGLARQELETDPALASPGP